MVELLVIFSVLAGVGVIGLSLALAAAPFVLQAGLFAEVGSILFGGVSEFFGRQRVIRFGCLVLAVTLPLICGFCLFLAILAST
ncbi:MAG: hypothetical protein IT323_16505 [Anaerolineae bacterium]|nr:hypothetical protein [Anaerolineae bacterium]